MISGYYDFTVPKGLRGKELLIEKVRLNVPQNAEFLIIDPIEEEEEFLGVQGNSNSQQAIWYNNKGEILDVKDLVGEIITDDLMGGLEKVLKKLY